MSEPELWEAFHQTGAMVASTFSMFLTITFAYLATAYFVGGRLSRFQASVVSFLYVFGSGLIIFETHVAFARARLFSVPLQQIHPEALFAANTPARGAFTALLLLSIPVCLFFMHQIRKDPRLGAGRT